MDNSVYVRHKHSGLEATVIHEPLHPIPRAAQLCSDDLHQALFEQAADGIFIADFEGRCVDVNRRGCEMLGYTRTELLKVTLYDLISPAHTAEDPLKIKELQRGEATLTQQSLRCRDGTWLPVEIRVQMLTDGHLLGIVRDISERMQFETRQRTMAAHTAALTSASRAFAEATTNYEALMATIARTLIDLLGDVVSIRLLSDDGEWLHPCAFHGVDSEVTEFIRTFLSTDSLHVSDETLFHHVVQKVEPVLLPHVDMNKLADLGSDQQKHLIRKLPIHSVIVAPLRVQGSVIGLLHLVRYQEEQPPFNEDEKDLVQDLADRAAMAIRNATLYRDLQVELAQRQQAEASLREEQTRFKQIVDTAPGIIHTFKEATDGTISFPYASPRIQEIYGISSKELAEDASQLASLIPPEDRERIRAHIAESKRNMSMWQTEFRVNHPEKGEIWVEGRSVPKKEPDGSLLWHGFLTEITDRKKAEERLHESETRFRRMANTAPAMLWITDTHNLATFLSHSWHEFTGQSEAEALGAGWLEVVHPDDREESFTTFVNAAEARASFALDYRLRRRDGSYRWAIDAGRPLFDTEGSWQGYMGSVIDIHDRKVAEEQVHQLNNELEQRVERRTAELASANRDLEAFAYSVSHDLRAPLRAINGYARILAEEYKSSLDAEGQRLLDVVCGRAQHMGALIDNLLTLSRLTRAEMHLSAIDMQSMVASIFFTSTTEQERAQIDFQVHDLPPAWGDPILLHQVWSNLLRNAIKFSSKKQHPSIEVGSNAAERETIYWVKDNGAGFDMQYAHKLFGIFQRLHSEQEFRGTGVGLAIVQRLVHRHAGRVWANAESSRGATFYFALPKTGSRQDNFT